jgi:hypothetical protein
MKTLLTLVATAGLALTAAAPALAQVDEVTPSTNESNQERGWAHFVVDDVRIGEVDITFVQPRSFIACFEVRIDGEAPQAPENFNPDVTDGLWPYLCLSGGTESRTFEADETVEIRMVFGAEGDERFDWTTVLPLTRQDCLDGGWEALGYKNQGQCVAEAVSD